MNTKLAVIILLAISILLQSMLKLRGGGRNPGGNPRVFSVLIPENYKAKRRGNLIINVVFWHSMMLEEGKLSRGGGEGGRGPTLSRNPALLIYLNEPVLLVIFIVHEVQSHSLIRIILILGVS